MKLTIKKTLCKLDRSGGILYMRHYISRGLYMFYTGLYCRATNITDNLCTNQGNSSQRSAVYDKDSSFQSRAGYNGACTVSLSSPRFLAFRRPCSKCCWSMPDFATNNLTNCKTWIRKTVKLPRWWYSNMYNMQNQCG